MKTTIAQLLNADDIRGLLIGLNAEAENIESMLCIVRLNDGDIRCKYHGFYPEILGLAELGRRAIIRQIEGNEGE